MKRREVITLLGGAAAAWPIAARAQHAKPVQLGFLPLGSPDNKYDQSLVEAFRQGCRQIGLVEGGDIVLDVVWISGDPNQAVSEVIILPSTLVQPEHAPAGVVSIHAANAALPERVAAPVYF